MSWQVKPRFIRSKWGSSWSSWTGCRDLLQKLTLLAESHVCRVWATVAFYRLILSIFLDMASNDFEMLVSSARRLSYFCGVCSNLASISSSFSSVNTFSSRFFWPNGQHFLNKFLDVPCTWNCVPEKFMTKFSPTLSTGTTFRILFVHKSHLLNSMSSHIDPNNISST